MHSVKLADGTELKNLELNGDNYISEEIILDDIFKDNLDNVTITDGGNEVVYTNMKLIQNKIYGTQSWFILAEKTREEIEKETLLQLLADLTETILLGGV